MKALFSTSANPLESPTPTLRANIQGNIQTSDQTLDVEPLSSAFPLGLNQILLVPYFFTIFFLVLVH
jgi:hypothetical protein